MRRWPDFRRVTGFAMVWPALSVADTYIHEVGTAQRAAVWTPFFWLGFAVAVTPAHPCTPVVFQSIG